MSIDTVRAGNAQSRQNEASFGVLSFELIVFSIFGGVYTGSWVVGGGVLVGTLLLLSHPSARILLMLLFSFAWAVLGFLIGGLFDSTGASVTLAVLGLLWGYGIHIQGFQHLDDLSK